jgi:hypothetical protein
MSEEVAREVLEEVKGEEDAEVHVMISIILNPKP